MTRKGKKKNGDGMRGKEKKLHLRGCVWMKSEDYA